MKPHYKMMFFVHLVGLADCCSVENVKNVVKNAIVSCPYNSWCKATCYRDFIFPSGVIEMSSYCKDGVWTPLLSSCKSLPVVSITYSAQWRFAEILPSKCSNISTRLDDLEKEIVDIFANQCQEIRGISASVQFNYSFMAFTLNADLTAVYRNYTSRSIPNTCVDVSVIAIPNSQNFTNMFDDVSCAGSNLRNTIYKPLYVSKRLEYCLNGTEVHNATTSGAGEIEQYCDFRNFFTSDTTSTFASDSTLSSSSLKSTPFATETWFTENNDYLDDTKSTDYFSKDDYEVELIIYIAAPAGGVLLISVITILVVCVQKREKYPKNLPAVDNKVYDNSFKGELIENELYQSADNAIDSTGDEVNSKVNMSVSSAAPNCKDLTQTEQELEQDQYSHPSKCKETNFSVDEFKDKEIDKLYSYAAQRGHQKTLNFDPDSDCQYAVVKE